jgi:hypothetical protein
MQKSAKSPGDRKGKKSVCLKELQEVLRNPDLIEESDVSAALFYHQPAVNSGYI